MIQIIVIVLCLAGINLFDTIPDNELQPEAFVWWCAVRLFAIGLVTTFITGIFDEKKSIGYLDPVRWYQRSFQYLIEWFLIGFCVLSIYVVPEEWQQPGGVFSCIIPLVIFVLLLYAARIVLDATENIAP